MVKVNRINISQVEGGYSNDSDKRPKGEMALYHDTNDGNDGYDLVIHDGINSTNLNKVLGKGKLYGHNSDSADGAGYDTIKLIPDIPAYDNGSHQYIVVDPTGPNHVHIRAGGPIDNSNSELIIGGENSYVKIGSGSNPPVYISSNDYDWTFNINGILQLASSGLQFSDGTIQNTAATGLIKDALSTSLIAGTGISLTYDEIADTLTIASSGGVGSNPFDQDLNTFNSPTFDQISISGYKITGGGTNSGDGNGYGTLELIPDSGLYDNNQYIIIDPTGPNHVHLRAGGTIDNSNSELIVGGEHSYLKVGAGTNPEIHIKSNDYNWTYNTNGEFIGPNGATIGPVGGGFPAFYNSQVNNPVVVLHRNIDSGLDLSALMLQPALSLENGGLATMVVAGTGVDSYEYWHFKNNGVLELASNGIAFADNTSQTTAWTGSISSSEVSDFNSSVSGLLPVKDILQGNNISISSASGVYTISSTITSVEQAASVVTTVFNNTGSPIPKMSAVYINGGQGDMPTVTLAVASGEMTSSKTYGITYESIAHMTTGKVVVLGALTGLNTDQFNPSAPHGDVNGTTLWLSPTTPGGLTTTKPSAPNHAVSVGTIVRTHQNAGVIEVRIQNGYELQELHNVGISNPQHNEILVYNSGTALWENNTFNPMVSTLVSASTINTDASSADVFDIVISQGITIANPTNPIDGKTICWRVTQDAIGSHTIALGNKFVVPTTISSPLAWSTTANSTSIISATYHASRDKWDVISFNAGY